MKALVCGGRDYQDFNKLYATLDSLLEEFGPFILVNGGATGADGISNAWAMERNIETRIYPAKWKLYGSEAGSIRNQEMLDKESPDLVIAFPGKIGTPDMIRRAKEARVEVRRIN